jgi:hypothetical protein
MSTSAYKKRPPDSSSFVSSKVIKFVTMCDIHNIDDELYDNDDDNILGHLSDEEDIDYTNLETADENDYLELLPIPCKTV